MRKTLWLFILLVIMVAVYLLFSPQGRSSLNHSDTDFAVEDTAHIHKIRLVRMIDGKPDVELLLEKDNKGHWTVNKKYPAFQARINQLLGLLLHLKVKETLIEQGLETGKILLEKRHTLVEISDEEALIKVIQVGTATKDYKGTLMRLDGVETPYIVERPGLQGFLNSYFTLDEEVWRSNRLFDGRLDQIQAISLQDLTAPELSWQLLRTNPEADWQWRGSGSEPNPTQIMEYLNLFHGPVYAESFASSRYPDALDQLKLRSPDMKFNLSYFDETSSTIFLFKREDNPNNYFGWIEGKEELLTIQTFVIDKFLSIQPLPPG